MDSFKDVTATQMKIYLAKQQSSSYIENIENIENEHVRQALKCDLTEIFKYRNESDPINNKTFKKWFPDDDEELLTWLDFERDFIYNSHGIRLLRNRYLRPREPIQYYMLRLAKLFIQNDNNMEDWRLTYDLLSCGYMHVSSILSDAEHADKNIVPGEACRLFVAKPTYDRALVNQVNEICNLVSLGVGIGMSASTVPLNGYNINGQIRSGFKSFAKKMDSCNYLTIYERKPKVAIYIEMHNNTIYEAFQLRNPLANHLENVFPAIMISDYFIECYENDKDWYLFPGDAQLDGKTLCDFSGDEYKIMYEKFVEAKLYTKIVPSSKLMDDLVTTISETGSPYVIWIDNVNRYSNHKHLGKIKTLNLCAEITNYATADRSSSCTLMSVNFATYKDFPQVLAKIYDYVERLENDWGIINRYTDDFEYEEMSTYAYTMGFMATLLLNRFMGPYREYRELGVSPMGVFDMAMIGNVQPTDIVAEVSEAMYKGCIHSSCVYSQRYDVQCKNYHGSPFSEGIPQWMLRDEDPKSDWIETMGLMKGGMANSHLTAQAPTATTSMLMGVTESVTLPASILIARESENGRNDLICYGLLYKLLNSKPVELHNNIDNQVLMYKDSSPFIDQSQSTMFSIKMSRQNILDLIMNTYDAKLKTSIYYTTPKQVNDTLTIVKKHSLARDYYESIMESKPKRARLISCDACSA